MKASQDELIKLLSGIDIIISAIYFASLADEVPLGTAAKIAEVKRFVQSTFIIVLPPRGGVEFRDSTQEIQW